MSETELNTTGRSDGPCQRSTFPNAVRDDTRLRKSIAKSYKWNLAQQGHDLDVNINFECLDRLPHGYSSWQEPRTTKTGKASDTAIYGHPSGRPFRAVVHFLDHWIWLERRGEGSSCLCCLCTKKRRVLQEGFKCRASLLDPHLQPRDMLAQEELAATWGEITPDDYTTPEDEISREYRSTTAIPQFVTRLARASDNSSFIVAGTQGPPLRRLLPKSIPIQPQSHSSIFVPTGAINRSQHAGNRPEEIWNDDLERELQMARAEDHARLQWRPEPTIGHKRARDENDAGAPSALTAHRKQTFPERVAVEMALREIFRRPSENGIVSREPRNVGESPAGETYATSANTLSQEELPIPADQLIRRPQSSVYQAAGMALDHSPDMTTMREAADGTHFKGLVDRTTFREATYSSPVQVSSVLAEELSAKAPKQDASESISTSASPQQAVRSGGPDSSRRAFFDDGSAEEPGNDLESLIHRFEEDYTPDSDFNFDSVDSEDLSLWESA